MSCASDTRCPHRTYGISCEDYAEMLADAQHACEICRLPATADRKLQVDHDHRYGWSAVRGLLCSECNKLMKAVDNGVTTDQRANDYLGRAWFLRVMHRRYLDGLKRKRDVPFVLPPVLVETGPA